MTIAKGLVLLLCLPVAALWAATPPLTTVATPDWVEVVQIDSLAHAKHQDGVASVIVLRDDQVSLLGAAPQHYRRVVVRLLGSNAVADWSSLKLDYEPSFESLSLHHVRAWRDGRWHDKLANVHARSLQRGESLDDGLIDDTATLSLVLDDTRVGDVLDLAYTVNGANPVFDGRYSDTFWVAADVPMERRSIRILHETSRKLAHRRSGPDLDHAQTTRAAGVIEDRWRTGDVPATRIDPGAPSWYSPDGMLQVSEFTTWTEVADWAVRLYKAEPAASGVVSLVNRLRREHPGDAAAQALAALRFVQDDIRYTGVEIGPGSHRPRSPNDVLDSRYGDCKDKVLLLVSAWRAMGLDAWPALVSSWQGPELPRAQPSPLAFDHVIAMLDWHGRTLWLDATAALQRGTLEGTAQARFDNALLVRDGSDALVPIPVIQPREPEVEVSARIDLRNDDGTIADSGAMEIHSVYRGAQADSLRRAISSTPADEQARNYLNYLADYFPGAVMTASPKVHDDPLRNLIEMTETYRLEDIWRANEEGSSTVEGNFWLTVISGYAARADSLRRNAPYALQWPLYVSERLEVELDDGWPTDHDDNNIATPWFKIDGAMDLEDNRMVMEASYRALVREVPATDMAAYDDALRRARDGFVYYLTFDKAGTNATDVIRGLQEHAADAMRLGMALLLGVFVVLAAGLTGLYRGANPFLAVWTRPRQVIREQVARHGDAFAYWLLAASTFLMAVVPSGSGHHFASFGLPGGMAMLVLVSILGAALQFGLCAVIAWWARRFGGHVGSSEVRHAMAWSCVAAWPYAIAGFAITALYGWSAMLAEPADWLIAAQVLRLLVLLVFSLWSTVCFLQMLAEVAGISVGRALAVFATYMLSIVLAILAVVLPLYLIAT